MSDGRVAARRGDLIAVVVCFAVVNLALVAVNGVRLGGDSPLYLDGAARMLDGRPLVDRQASYRGYVAVVAAAQAIGIGTLGVVVIQVLLGAASATVVFTIGATLAGRLAGAIGAVLYSVDVGTNRWHQFILADSIYTSLFVIAVGLTYRAATRTGFEPLLSAMLAAFGASVVRPEGWFLLPAIVGYLMIMRPSSVAQKVSMATAAGLAAATLGVLLPSSYSGNLQAVGPANMLQRGQTIWEFDGWRLDMPAGETLGHDQAGTAIGYALRHPVSTVKLMLARVAVHFAHVRPFYSTPHNLAIVLWLIPLYAAAVFALWRMGPTPLNMWIVIAIATQTAVVALTHAEWDGRYLAHVLPLLDPLAGSGVALAFAGGDPVRPMSADA